MAYNPSWLPSWPASAPDFETAYKASVPNQWPRGLFSEDSQARLDQEMFAIVLSALRKGSWWVRKLFWPWIDAQYATDGLIDEPMFLPDWQEVFGLAPKGDWTTQGKAVLTAMRTRGTTTLSKIKAIFAPVFGTEDPDNISVLAPTPTNTWAGCLNGSKLYWPYDVTQDLNCIAGSSYQCVWAVGPGGKIYLSTIADPVWTEKTSGTAQDLYGVWAPVGDSDFAWAVGNAGTIREWSGAAWGAGPGGGPADNLKAVSGTLTKQWDGSAWVPEEMWVCGAGRRVSHYDGSAWTNETPGNVGAEYEDIHVYAIDDVWACDSQFGDVVHWDGNAWTTYSAIAGGDGLYGIRKMPNGKVYTVGETGKIYEYDSSWSLIASGTTEDLYGIDGWSDDRLVVVGQNGICLRYTGEDDDTWEIIELNCWHNLNSVWVDRTTCYSFCAGDDGWTQSAPNSDEGFAANQNCLHIYSTNEDLPPDDASGFDRCELCEAAWQRWSYGQKHTIRASDTACGAGRAAAG